MQRAVLARELSGDVDVLIVANPCFGLDFASVAEIRSQIMEQRNRGAAVLLVSEDLDEILELVRPRGGDVGRHDQLRRRRSRTPTATPSASTWRGIDDGLCSSKPRPYDFVLEPRHVALVVIDMQRDFIEPGGFGAALGNDVSRLGRKIVPTVAALIALFRRAELPIVHTREAHRPDLPACPPAKRLRGKPGLGIGDLGAMGHILVARRTGQPDPARTRAGGGRDRHRQAGQGHVLGDRPA